MRRRDSIALLGEQGTRRQVDGMKTQPHQNRPGQMFIDRYMPSASEAAREEAYDNLRELIAILVEIDDRLERERKEAIRTNAAGAVDSEMAA